jgi:hypothetical protein
MTEIKARLIWTENKAAFSTGERGSVGGIWLFETCWASGTDTKGSKLPPWAISHRLPGLKQIDNRFESEGKAKQFCEKALSSWLKKTGLAND